MLPSLYPYLRPLRLLLSRGRTCGSSPNSLTVFSVQRAGYHTPRGLQVASLLLKCAARAPIFMELLVSLGSICFQNLNVTRLAMFLQTQRCCCPTYTPDVLTLYERQHMNTGVACVSEANECRWRKLNKAPIVPKCFLGRVSRRTGPWNVA
jgi:hypothetical protein